MDGGKLVAAIGAQQYRQTVCCQNRDDCPGLTRDCCIRFDRSCGTGHSNGGAVDLCEPVGLRGQVGARPDSWTDRLRH
jgi:hypothetical protein